MAELLRLTVLEMTSDQGTVVVFQGVEDETDLVYTFGCDHRSAQALVSALEAGDDVQVEVEGWQILGSPAPLQA